jgi:hypothetical protein
MQRRNEEGKIKKNVEVSRVRAESDQGMEKKRHYEILGRNEYGRFLLVRQPGLFIIAAGESQLPLIELQLDIKKRVSHE